MIGVPVSQIAKNVFHIEEYDFGKNDWTLGVSLYIGTYGVDRQLENVKTMLFPMISKEKLKQLDDAIFLLEDQGVQFFFEKWENQLKLRKIILSIFLERTQKEQKPSEMSIIDFFDSLSLTTQGAGYIFRSEMIDNLEQKLKQHT